MARIAGRHRYLVCPRCGRRGVGRDKKHWTGGALFFLRSCRYCHAVGRMRVTPGRPAPDKFTWD